MKILHFPIGQFPKGQFRDWRDPLEKRPMLVRRTSKITKKAEVKIYRTP